MPKIHKCLEESLSEPVGSLLFHYTSFESAVKITGTKSFRFSDFSNMNDVSENSKVLLNENCKYDKVFKKYHSLSFTLDGEDRRGFALDTQWGYYSQGGKGVCLVFDKDVLINGLKKKKKNNLYCHKICYCDYSTTTLFCGSDEVDTKGRIKEDSLMDLFFEKSNQWEHEREYRVLLYNRRNTSPTIEFPENALVGAITRIRPKREDKYIPNTPENTILATICGKNRAFRLVDAFGDVRLYDYDGEEVYPKVEEELLNDDYAYLLWTYTPPFAEDVNCICYHFYSDGSIKRCRCDANDRVSPADIGESTKALIISACPYDIRERIEQILKS